MQRPGPACDGPACNVTEGPVQAALTPGTPAAVGSTSRLSVVGLCDVTPPRLSKASPPEPKQAQHAIHSNALIGKLEGGLTKAEARAEHIRQQYSWLSESQVRDAMGKRPGEVGYDPRSALVVGLFVRVYVCFLL